MAIDIKFDLSGNPEPPTIILANRSGNILGQLNVDAKSIEVSDKFNDVSEFSFILYKYIDNKVNNLWDKVVDFKLVYCKEWDMWFEIKVELDESTKTTKTVLCTQLGQAELSQIMLYDIEINTEKDIERDDYKISILYDEKEPKASILNRMLEKAPHYRIAYVDPTIAKIQRSFSFNDTSIADGFDDIGEEIGCLFRYPSNSDGDRKIKRDIFVYDLQQNCNDCGHRGEFLDVCPKCGSKNIKYGYGEDTLIFVTSDELATEGIQLVADTDSVKNCFKLEAGDDLMTATVRNCNPNGTDYIWYFSDSIKEDMSKELVERLDSYDKIYKQYYNEHESDIDIKLLSGYNKLVEKYSVYNKNLQSIKKPIKGYPSLMNAYYNTIDLALYLKSGLMPTVEMSGTNANEQAKLLTASSLSSVSVANLDTVSVSTANNAVLAMAKIVIRSTYKIQVNLSELIYNGDKKIWRGNFVITNYSDEEDTAVSDIIDVNISDDIETFVRQKIDKTLNKENTDDLSISGLFEKEYNEFCAELKKYALNPLISFHSACQACLDILIEQGVSKKESWADFDEGSESNLYDNLYMPYHEKMKAIEDEMKIREAEIGVVSGVYDVDGSLLTNGLQSSIEDCRAIIQDALNFEKYMGNELWLEFCSYRREDKYSNDNYVSDGLNNAELFKRALEFFEVAENEIYKSAELQCSISTTLNNLLAIPKFKPLVKHFKTGNWIRVRVDEKIYKLRLLKYEIDFGDFNNISVEFSDVSKMKNSITDLQSVLSQASSIATSYDGVKRQASQGAKGSSILNNWVEGGLNATQTKIVDSYDENLMFGKNAFWCRQYDPITDTYSDEQIKIVNSTIAITDDNWETTKTAIGKYYYIDPITKETKVAYGVNGETIVGKLLVGENAFIVNDEGSLRFDGDGLIVEGKNENDETAVSVTINPNDSSVFTIKDSNDNYILHVNNGGKLSVMGNITATSFTLLDSSAVDGTINVDNIGGLHPVATSGDYDDLSDTPTKLSDFENDKSFIDKNVNNLTNYYKKTETDDKLNSKANSDDLSEVATSGSVNDLVDIDDFKKWVLEQIQLATKQ